jgi:hypothetical protein
LVKSDIWKMWILNFSETWVPRCDPAASHRNPSSGGPKCVKSDMTASGEAEKCQNFIMQEMGYKASNSAASYRNPSSGDPKFVKSDITALGGAE